MQGKPVGASLQQCASAALAVNAGKAQIELTRHAAFAVKLRFFCNAVVNYIDHTANRAAALLPRAQATQNFNAVNADGVRRDGVVKAERRHIEQAAAVIENADAVAVLSANNRLTGAGAKVGAADARRAIKRLAQSRFKA